MAASSTLYPLIFIGIVLLFVALIVLSVKFKTFGKVIGALFLTAGAIGVIMGIIRSNSYESQLIREFEGQDEVMAAYLVVGGLGIFLGVLCLICGLTGKKPVINVQTPAINNQGEYNIKIRCPKCQALNNENSKFCTFCGNLMIRENNVTEG